MAELCPCSALDWTGEDMTKEHHPECVRVPTIEWMKGVADGLKGDGVTISQPFGGVSGITGERFDNLRAAIEKMSEVFKKFAELSELHDPPSS